MLDVLLILVFVLLIYILSAIAFAVGFFIGFARVNPRQTYKKAAQGEKSPDNAQKLREEKAKREWKKFLGYDGSGNADVSNSK